MNYLKKVQIKQISAGRIMSDEPVSTPEKAVELMRNLINDSDREIVLVLTLDVRLQPINVSTVSVGTLSGSVVCAREVFKTAILSNASGIILAHNHPSGDVTPSPEDVQVTENIKKAGEILGIRLLDHIITTRNGMYSFRENGELTGNTEVAVLAAEKR